MKFITPKHQVEYDQPKERCTPYAMLASYEENQNSRH
jgi:hypothetical protein